MYVVLCLIVFGCQYQCNWLPGKTRLRMTYYVSSGTLNPTHSLTVDHGGWWARLWVLLYSTLRIGCTDTGLAAVAIPDLDDSRLKWMEWDIDRQAPRRYVSLFSDVSIQSSQTFINTSILYDCELTEYWQVQRDRRTYATVRSRTHH